ncbi:hypothetical protein [Candidatus Manganitrophus noduliformans]|uniref:Uncharacterized protein n=1 Tax=Candidatus Manganitrophus noduliformans TaxID=2606439 RepID=A0A7X6DMW1_9BACT|nr:hypothetical protein [Candidatus Manganitrophus noduliformans]NKE70130.1 hypothetical protein [Candidatus Manganitrophus noduliformans]
MTNTRSDRINISSEKHDTYKHLTEGPTSPFKTMKDLFLTSAAIGVEKGIRKAIEKPTSIFAWSVFTSQEDIPFLYALVLSIGEPIDILLEQGKILDLLEEYANTGIEELERELLSSTMPSLMLANKILEES